MIDFKEHKALKDYDSVSLGELLRTYITENYPIAYVNKISDAIQVASYLHRGVVRRGARGVTLSPPYIEHPLRVAIRLYKYFGVTDIDIIIAAILHDTVEDHMYDFDAFQGVSIEETDSETVARQKALDFLASKFGYRTAAIVEQVSNPLSPAGQTKQEKLAAYHEHVSTVVRTSPAALILKFSDFIDNAGSLHHHYKFGDTKVLYFVDRYEPLIAIYQDELEKASFSSMNQSFVANAALKRLKKVEENFALFREAAEKTK